MPADSLTEAFAVLESFVSDFEPGLYSGDDASVLVERFARGEHLCATGKALAAKRAAETELHRRDGHRSAAEWLARKTGESLGHAAGSLQLADQMEHHPELGDALRSGELSHSRAHKVADVLRVDPDSEDELVEAAKNKDETNRQLADRCLRAKAKARSVEDARAHYERIRKARYLSHYTDRDGAFHLEGLFTPDAGAKVLAALKPTRSAIVNEARRLGLRERPEAYGADALVALLTGQRQPLTPIDGRPADDGDTARAAPDQGRPKDNDRTHSEQSDSDQASSERAGSDRAGSDRTDSDPADSERARTQYRPTAIPPPASVHLRVDLGALRRGSLKDGECCEIPGVGSVPIETARSVLGDAIVQLVITKGKDIATVCNLGRSVPVPVQTALNERDLTCVVPGCDVREGLETDHRIIPFVDNGETALWNLSKLCSWHHYLKTWKGFRIEGGPGDWRWIPPEQPLSDHPDDPDDGGDADDRLFQLE
ncbi:MAG TPA: HNH endonuclease signature motif containing protein [Acidimicrobiales bacterium]|nr:HNH endonuclease signature motif containing protein [Acidimicrobiales bacterium]